MKAKMEMRFDTTWGNQILLEVSSELDNPSLHGTRDIAALMTHSLHAMLDEVRTEDERWRAEGEPRTSEEILAERGLARRRTEEEEGARVRREHERFEEMEREHATASQFHGRGGDDGD